MRLLLLLLLVGCTPVKRFNRLVERHPYLITTDSTTLHDTVKVEVPQVRVDTVFHTSMLHDTVTIEKERLKVKLWQVNDTVYTEAKCDSVIVEKIRETKVPVKYFAKDRKYLYWFAILAALIIIFTYVRFSTTTKR